MMENLLMGAVSLDIYTDDGRILPGGGCLNIAYHWRQLGVPFLFLTRIGRDRPEVFTTFFARHGIRYLPDEIVGGERSSTIDIAFGGDRQPRMDHFVPGVWADFRLRPQEEALVAAAASLHTVLIEGVIAELGRLGRAGILKRPLVSADFLDFRHYTPVRMAETLDHVDLGFVGWPGEVDDPLLDELRELALAREKLLIITLGGRGVRVFDGRPQSAVDRFYPVEPLPVTGNTVGCGDAFSAYFLAEFRQSGEVDRAVAAGMTGGALPIAWLHPLPADAYQDL